MRPSRALLAAVAGWLIVASGGILAAQGIAPDLRLGLVAALWICAAPALRRDLALRARASVRSLEHRGGREWRLTDASGRTVPALPGPHSMVLGAMVWLECATAQGVRRACVIDRALAVHLRLAGRRSPAGRSRAARIAPGT